MKHVSKLAMGALLLTLISCGKDDGGSSPSVSRSELQSEEGYFKADLAPLNAHVAGDVTGEAKFKIIGDTMSAEVKVNGAPSQIVHIQNVHTADACPTLATDANNDGIIDAVEGQSVYGPALIPLDGDLRSQKEGATGFPTADFSGNYYYGKTVSLKEMMTDLSDKLEGNLALAGRQVVIYGTASDASLPVACGTIMKVDAPIDPNTDGDKE